MSTFAVIGLFDSADALMDAIPTVKEKKLGRLEAYTPYPIHGMDKALELRRSPLGGMVLVMGILGALTAIGFEYWISAIDYPLVTGGKAPWSWEAFVPIMFEVMVAFATFTAGLGMLMLLNKQPFFGHPILHSKAIQGITRDRFALAIEADPELNTEAAKQALMNAGAADIEILEKPDTGPFLDAQFILRALGAIFVSCLVAGIGMYAAVKLTPITPPISHMLDQPRLDPQQATSFFADHRAMRPPVPGTVARGYLPMVPGTQEEAATLVNPLPRTPDVLAMGQQAFNVRCALCHGLLGNGIGSLGAAYGGKPANLQAPQFLAYPDGKIYWTIMNGKNAMPKQGQDLSEDQRWAVVHYVRVLQRALNAKDEDLP